MDDAERYRQSWLDAEASETRLIEQVANLKIELKKAWNEIARLRGDKPAIKELRKEEDV